MYVVNFNDTAPFPLLKSYPSLKKMFNYIIISIFCFVGVIKMKTRQINPEVCALK